MPHKYTEERRAYNKEYNQENKEEIRLQRLVYRQTPKGKKAYKKADWKAQGIIINDFDKFYDLFLSTTHCQICKKKLTVDKKNTHSTKCVDHDHNITDKENVRYICCLACNSNDNCNNTSGEPNIYFEKRSDNWLFKKIIKGKIHISPLFKTKREAINYKYSFLHKLKQIEINKEITFRLLNGTCRKHQTGQR